MTAPAAPATNSVRIYAEDNGAGSTQLVAKFATGISKLLAEQDANTTLSTVTPTALHTFPVATYRSCKYTVQITQGVDYQVSDILVIHNGTNAFYTEYAVIETGSKLATLSADVSGADARLMIEMASATTASIIITKNLISI